MTRGAPPIHPAFAPLFAIVVACGDDAGGGGGATSASSTSASATSGAATSGAATSGATTSTSGSGSTSSSSSSSAGGSGQGAGSSSSGDGGAGAGGAGSGASTSSSGGGGATGGGGDSSGSGGGSLAPGALVFGCGEATPVAEGSCADPLALSLPAYLRGSAFLHPDESGVNCPVGTLSAERFAYAVEVPAGETLRARLTTWLLGGFFPEFWIGPSCDVAYPCVDGINFSPEIEVKTIEWPNGTGRAVTMIVGGAAIHSSTYELQIELVSEASTCGPACELGEACVEGVCTSIVDSCPLPRVTFPDGACGSPAFTTAACDCGAACAAGESCLDGACLASPPGESCASPLDRGAGLPPQVATSVTVEAADGPVIASPFGGTTHAVDATIRFDAGAFGCRDLTVLADPESAVTAGRPLDAWLLVELFDDQPCSGAPLASQLFVPQWGPYDSPNLFTLPEGLAGPVRLRASWVALDDQGPIVVSVAHHPLACL